MIVAVIVIGGVIVALIPRARHSFLLKWRGLLVSSRSSNERLGSAIVEEAKATTGSVTARTSGGDARIRNVEAGTNVTAEVGTPETTPNPKDPPT